MSPEDKTNTQLGNAVINDIRELVDQIKTSRSDCARTTLSVIAASTSGLNVQKEHKKSLIATKIGLPLKRLENGSVHKFLLPKSHVGPLLEGKLGTTVFQMKSENSHTFSELTRTTPVPPVIKTT